MRLPLRSDEKFKIFGKVKVYLVKLRDRVFINKILNALHFKNKIFFIKKRTPFSYSVFVI